MGKTSSRAKKPSIARRALSLLVPLIIVGVWLTAAGVGGPYFGRIEEVSTNDPASFLPASAESTNVNEKLKSFRDSSTVPVIIIFESDTELTAAETAEVETIRDQLVGAKVAAGDISPLLRSDNKKATFFLVPISSDADFDETVPEITEIVDEAEPSLSYGFSGPALFSRDLQAAFAGIDGTLLAVALSVVFVILLIVYRSPLLPVVTLVGALAALSAAILAVFYLAKADIVVLNGQVQGILFILVIGAAADYSLLYIARYREELGRHRDRLQATKAAWKASVEPIVAAGGTVMLGLMCLLASDLASNQALGPVGSLGILFAILVALTYLPAALLLLGRSAFWPRRPQAAATSSSNDDKLTHSMWLRVARFVSRYPRRIWIGTITVLLIACAFLPQLRAEGVSQENLIIGPSDAREGQAMLNKHFADGSGSPAYVIVPQEQVNGVVALLDQDEGIESVAINSDDDRLPAIPVGESADELEATLRESISAEINSQRNEIRQSIAAQLTGAPSSVIDRAYRQAVANIPSIDSLVSQANPFVDAEPNVRSGKVLLEATLRDNASSVKARETIERLRTAIQPQYSEVVFGGVSAIQLDTNTASSRDLKVVIPLILLSITIVLMLLLRSIVAPLILVATTVLSFGATLGVSALLFNHIWQFPGADPAVIIFGFVFLVALGIDYNIFLMTRVREETLKHGVREGTLRALVVTGGVITSAGIVLAATFAALNVIPILFLAQIAFIVAFGVLLDTFIVRSLLVPALTLEIGRPMWWPSRLYRSLKNK